MPRFSANLPEVNASLLEFFQHFTHPSLKKNLLQLNAIKAIEKKDATLFIELQMPFPWQQGLKALRCYDNELKTLTHCQHIEWQLSHNIVTLKRANDLPAVKGVKNIIAVSSGKGGVGKSTVAVNLALGLQQLGAKVGILDADIYGPSVPLMLGCQDQRPTSPDDKHMSPIKAFDILANSIGFLVPPENATVWRGSLACGALMQLLNETLWVENGRELDYLVIDLPPGTGDIQLTLAQQIPVTGAVVVTTPQDVALIDAMKGVQMFHKVKMPVLGVVENMAMHICENCGHHEAIFGTGGAEKMAEKYGIEILGKLPLHLQIRQKMDQGTPTVVAQHSPHRSLFLDLAQQVASELYWQGDVIPSEIFIKTL